MSLTRTQSLEPLMSWSETKTLACSARINESQFGTVQTVQHSNRVFGKEVTITHIQSILELSLIGARTKRMDQLMQLEEATNESFVT
jgi:hypothetical protein